MGLNLNDLPPAMRKQVIDSMTAKPPVRVRPPQPTSAIFKIELSTDEAKLNKTERARLAWLNTTGVSGLGIQSVTLKLGDDCRFTPDFHYIDANGRMVFEDVKGFQRDDALVKIKVAARKFSWATFLIVKKEKGGWEVKEIRP